MRTGEVEANLLALNEEFRLPYIGELVARKLSTHERQTIEDADVTFFESEYARLRTLLEEEEARSALPEQPSSRAGLHALLLRIRGVA
jgi:predicted nucleotidyltransferase